MVAGDADMVRASTAKQNIRYAVLKTAKPGTSSIIDEACKTVLRLTERMVEGSGDSSDDNYKVQWKGVIYWRSRALCEVFAARIGCRWYHAGMDIATRRNVLESWARDSPRADGL